MQIEASGLFSRCNQAGGCLLLRSRLHTVDTLLEKEYRGKGAELFRKLEQEFAQRRNAERPRAESRPQQQVRMSFPSSELTLQWSPTPSSPPYTIAS